MFELREARRAVHADRRLAPQRSPCSATRCARSSSAPTASRATATRRTRSARTASRSPPRTTAFRSTSPRRARRSTSRSQSGARDPDRGAHARRSAHRRRRRGLQPCLRRHAGPADHRLHHRVRRAPAAVRRRHRRPRDPPQFGSCSALKFYDFVDKQPKLDGLVIIEGRTRARAARARDAARPPAAGGPARAQLRHLRRAGDRAIGAPSATRSTPCRFWPSGGSWSCAIASACARSRGATSGRSPKPYPPATRWCSKTSLPPAKKTKPEPFGAMAGRKATRIDTTPNADVRERFVRETLERLGAKAAAARDRGARRQRRGPRRDPERPREARARRRHDHLAALERESLAVEDPKAWQYASAVVDGRAAEALAIAFELFANDPRGAAVPLASALAGEFGLLWELARPDGGASAPPPLARAHPAPDRAAGRRAACPLRLRGRGARFRGRGHRADRRPARHDRAPDGRSRPAACFLAPVNQRNPPRARPTSRSDRGLAFRPNPRRRLPSAH